MIYQSYGWKDLNYKGEITKQEHLVFKSNWRKFLLEHWHQSILYCSRLLYICFGQIFSNVYIVRIHFIHHSQRAEYVLQLERNWSFFANPVVPVFPCRAQGRRRWSGSSTRSLCSGWAHSCFLHKTHPSVRLSSLNIKTCIYQASA